VAAKSASAHRWVLGLTGGIASGKSTVAAQFAALGADVIDLDEVAREVVAPGTALLARVLERFGQSLQKGDGSLDRRALRTMVFADPAARRDLESMLHPAIQARTTERLAASHGPYQIVVNPLLVESQARARYDRVLLVDCEVALQRERLAARDQQSPAAIDAMLAAQTSREARRASADDVIENHGNPARLQQVVADLHQHYLGLAQGSSTIER
jgi:dephospho-CoA kinase